MTADSTLVLVDGSSYLYRAFHALPPLINSTGQPTGAVYGVTSMLRKLQKDYPDAQVVVVFDPKGKTFRDDLYPAYKAHRPPMPDDLRGQIQPLFDIIQALGFPLLIIEGVEADDVIGTLAIAAVKQNYRVVISTGDKDIAQLVNEEITLINTMSNSILDIEGVLNKFGVLPTQIVDYLSLVGDSVDNIPGVPKVGPKTAVKWLQEFGSLDAILENADKIGGKVGENLRASLAHLPLTRQLVTIKTDVDIEFSPEIITAKKEDKEKLIQLSRQLEFKSLLKELTNDVVSIEKEKIEITKAKHELILEQSDFDRWLEKLKQATLIAIDTETTSLDYMQAELVGISFAVQAGESAYLPLGHDYLGAPEQLNKQQALQQLKPILENPHILKIGHNLKYDMTIFASNGIELASPAFDTMLLAFLYGSGGRYDMDTVALKFLNYQTTSFTDIAGKGAKQLTFNQIDLATAAPYAAEDADLTFRLYDYLWPKIAAKPALKKCFTEIEMPLVPILSQMERNGVLINAALLQAQSQEIGETLSLLETQAYELAGQVFNLSSPKQLQEILYQKMQLPILQKTPTGQPSTAEEVLQELAADYPLPALIIQHRSLSKLKSTYTDKLPQQINTRTGRVHTSYHQVGAATGRFSSSDPNLQNIPIRTAEGRRIRQAFIAPAGHKIIAADYSQIELRIMAHLSQDEGLIQAFAEGLDIHKATAAEVFGVPLAEVSSLQRRSAKAINFGLIYGMSAFGLAKQLDIERAAAQNYMDLYFSRYPGVKLFMEKTRIEAHENAYVETLLGRRLYLQDINSRNTALKRGAERAAVNAPMQGTAADIIKSAMINMDKALKKQGFKAKMIMQVHDELVFEVPEAEVEALIPIIKAEMGAAAQLCVPLVVDVGIGNNWDEAHG